MIGKIAQSLNIKFGSNLAKQKSNFVFFFLLILS